MARIRIENTSHEFYRTLARDDGDTATKKTFETMKEVFMIAFGFGVAKGQRGALGSSREIFDDSLFRAEDWDLIKAAVLADDETALQSLEDTDQLLRVAQEYANAGIRLMQNQYLAAKPEESLAALLLDALAT
jgi:hypothetical protein